MPSTAALICRATILEYHLWYPVPPPMTKKLSIFACLFHIPLISPLASTSHVASIRSLIPAPPSPSMSATTLRTSVSRYPVHQTMACGNPTRRGARSGAYVRRAVSLQSGPLFFQWTGVNLSVGKLGSTYGSCDARDACSMPISWPPTASGLVNIAGSATSSGS